MDKVNEKEHPVDQIAAQFLQYYYSNISVGVEDVIKCYSEDSTIKRFNNPEATGLQNIEAELKKHYNKDFRLRIGKITAINSLGNSIILQVGAEYFTGGQYRPVIQNVVLVSRGNRSFYIHTDVVDYVESLVPAPVKKPKQNGHHAHQPVPQTQQIPQQQHQEPRKLVDESQKTKIPQDPAPKTSFEPSQPTPLHHLIKQNTPQQSPQKPPAPSPQKPLIQPLSHQPIPQEPPKPIVEKPTGPATWSKIVSGERKSNGLPPPTAPPPALFSSNPVRNGGNSGGFGGPRGSKCYKCGNSGHFSRDCPDQEKARRCYNCNESGHISRKCPTAAQ